MELQIKYENRQLPGMMYIAIAPDFVGYTMALVNEAGKDYTKYDYRLDERQNVIVSGLDLEPLVKFFQDQVARDRDKSEGYAVVSVEVLESLQTKESRLETEDSSKGKGTETKESHLSRYKWYYLSGIVAVVVVGAVAMDHKS